MPAKSEAKAAARTAGLQFYETGIRCRNGHMAPRRVRDGGCVDCTRASVRSYRASQKTLTKEERQANQADLVKRRSLAQEAFIAANPNAGTWSAAKAAAKAHGSKRWTPGFPCVNGHKADRLVSSGQCVECLRLYREENKVIVAARIKCWRAAHPAYVGEMNQAYYRENREEMNAYSKAWRLENLEAARARDREYHAANRESRNAATALWRENNPEKYAASDKAWKDANPEKVRTNWRNRRARVVGAEGWHTKEDIDRIRLQQRGICAYCPAKLKNGEQLDHIISLANGGTNWPRNLQLTCPPCNRKKNTKDPITWARLNGKLL
jgi:5-methylcytosine-specific restriction endonuclease McrA